MSDIFGYLVVILIFAIPVMFIAFIIRWILKKSKRKLGITILISIGCFVLFTICGVLTYPPTWCEHQYELKSEKQATCEVDGQIIKYCPLCNNETYEKIPALTHNFEQVSRTDSEVVYKCSLCKKQKIEELELNKSENKVVTSSTTENTTSKSTQPCKHKYELVNEISPSCTKKGEKTQRCTLCGISKEVNIEALGHKMKEFSRVSVPNTYEEKIISKCSRCDYKKTEIIKLTYIKSVNFDEIYLAYEENPLRAADKYEGNRYRITAEINGMTTGGLANISGGATLTMETKVGNTYVFFYAEFEKEQEEILKTVNKGDTITFEGTCVDSGNWSECEIIVE